MKPTTSRPFGLLDLIILVFAFGPVFLILRERYEYYREPSTPDPTRTHWLIFAVANAILIGLTFAFAAFVLRRPRAALRVVLRRPGPAAIAAACAGMIVMMTRMSVKTYSMHVSNAVLDGRPDMPFDFPYVYPQLVGGAVRIGFAVLGAWTALLLTRGWRPEPSWLDRGGRLLGWAWLSLAFLYVLLPWIEPFLPAI